MARRIALCAAALSGAVLASCLLPSDPGTIRVHFALPSDTIRIGIADTATPCVTVLVGSTPLADAHLQFESADSTIVSINDAGKILARHRGTAYVRVRFVSVAAGETPLLDSFPARGVVTRLALGQGTTLAAIGDTLRLLPAFLDAAGAHLAASDSAAATAALSAQLLSSGAAVKLESGNLVRALASGSDTVRLRVDTCRLDFVVSVRQRAASVAITPGAFQFHALGQTRAFNVTVLDSGGGQIAQPSVTWQSTAPAVVSIGTTGVATANANGAAELVATVDGIADTAGVTIAQVPVTLAFTTQPSSAVAGTAITPAVNVTVEDSLGYPVTGASSFITVALGPGAGGATLSGTLGRSAVSGVASFGDLSVDKAGSGYTLLASASGLTSTSSAMFGIMPAAATKLTFSVQPSRTPKSSIITPAVQGAAQDQFGNTVSAFTGNVTISIASGTGGATLSGTLTVPASGGIATFNDLSINRTGTNYKLSVTATGLSAATSAVFSITAPTMLVFTVQPSSTTPNAIIAPAVQVAVEDGFGNIATGYSGSIAIGITNGSGTAGAAVNGTTTVAIVNGVGTFANLSVTLSGSAYQFTASDPANVLSDGTSMPFDIQ